MRINSAGKVGIGTDSLAADSILTIGTTASTGLTLLSVSNAGESFINFADTADVNAGRIYYGHGDNAMRFRTNDGLRMIINSSGNVGINTTNPLAKLTVNQDSFSDTEGIFVQSGDNAAGGGVAIYKSASLVGTVSSLGSNSALTFQTNGGLERMRIASNGGVGINTTNPSEKLEVNGNVKVQGDIIVNSDIELGPSSRIQLDDTPTASTASGSGTIVNWSVSESTTAGTLYTVKSNGGWTTTDADIELRSIGMLAIALSSNANLGMLLQGFFYKASHGFTIGLPLYISNTAGAFSTTRPTGTNDYVRIIGYATSANYIYFDPDKTWVQVA
jgi:hypothetical protein